MCMSSKPPSAPAPPPPPPAPAKKADASVRRARDESKRKSRGMQGDAATQLTGPRGLMAEAKTGSTLLSGS